MKLRNINDTISDQDPLQPANYHFFGFYGLEYNQYLPFKIFNYTKWCNELVFIMKSNKNHALNKIVIQLYNDQTREILVRGKYFFNLTSF